MPPDVPFDRRAQLERASAEADWDVIVIGGGATGAGVALDAALRGRRTLLLEQHDFGKGTSSRSTKLVHGGVRYLQQGNITLVRDALQERGLLRANAPHLVHALATIVPLYEWWERPYYWLGLKTYDALAGRLGLGASGSLSRDETIAELPTIERESLRGGVRYYDGAFDDARLLINLVQTAAEQGAACLNYARVESLMHEGTRVAGVVALDAETGAELRARAKVVINAAGPFSDQVRRMDKADAEGWIAPSQGAHIMLPERFMPTRSALIVPRTSDGRVVFAIPWHNRVMVGTTDHMLSETPLEPTTQDEEIEFLLETVGRYLNPRPTRDDITATFAGIRPLVKGDPSKPTSKLGRDHQVRVADSGLVSVIGGKWTTYRKMAEDTVDHADQVAGVPAAPCRTREFPIHGAGGGPTDGSSVYGADEPSLQELIKSDPAYAEPLDAELPYLVGHAVWAARHEMAQTVEDVLSRRLRALLLDARATVRAAPRVSRVLADALGLDDETADAQVRDFERVAAGYIVPTE